MLIFVIQEHGMGYLISQARELYYLEGRTLVSCLAASTLKLF